MKIVKVKKDANPHYKQFLSMIKILKTYFGQDWNTAYDKIVNDADLAELEQLTALAGGANGARLIKAAKNLVMFLKKWDESLDDGE